MCLVGLASVLPLHAEPNGKSDKPQSRPSTQPNSLAARTSASQRAERLAHSPRNLLANPRFEEGRDPWWSFAGPERPYWADFDLSTEQAHTGHRSARLTMTGEDYDDTKRIYGVIQEVAPESLPHRLSGWYRVEDWKRGTKNQYLQVVVIVWNPQNLQAGTTNVQISYVLGGITEPPFQIGNRRFIFLGEKEPEVGEWVRFDRNLTQDFLDAYGVVPQGFDRIRVLYEVRFDGRTASDGEISATVYYDDLYLGP